MRKLIHYISLFTLGIAIFIPVLAIATCASALVVLADELITIELYNIINGRPNHNR